MATPPARPSRETIAALTGRLSPLLGSRLSGAEAVRMQHAAGEGLRDPFPPDLVAFVRSTEEAAAVVKACAEFKAPVVPFGAGSSLEGQLQALHGGVSLDLSGMDAILEVSPENLDCRVQAGVTREQLNTHLRDVGLFFPVDPGANATLGGMASTRASGTTTVRYGAMKDLTLALTVVTASGEIARTGARARKSAAGYDLTRLFIGAEGTLGVITELTLRLFGIPEAQVAAVCPFETLEGAIATATACLQLGLPVARIELLDELQMRASIRHANLTDMAEKPTLFLEFHGSPTGVEETAEAVRAIADEYGGSDYRWAKAPEERSRLWRARHGAYYAGRALRPGAEALATDACVPISRLAECILETRAEAQASGLVCPILGHVGDGNFHVTVLFDPENDSERAAAETLASNIARRAIRLGGTCTGEHGVGMHKTGYLVSEHGAEGVALMRAVKAALDPAGIMNPGKLIPA